MKSIDKPLLDTNVCLDLLLKRKPFLQEASAIFQYSEQGAIQGVISAISVDTLAYIMQSDFSAAEAAEKLKAMISITAIGMTDEKIIKNALDAGYNDIEDAIQHQCAKENGCNAIITRNKKDFTRSSLPVFTPAEFLKQCNPDEEK